MEPGSSAQDGDYPSQRRLADGLVDADTHPARKLDLHQGGFRYWSWRRRPRRPRRFLLCLSRVLLLDHADRNKPQGRSSSRRYRSLATPTVDQARANPMAARKLAHLSARHIRLCHHTRPEGWVMGTASVADNLDPLHRGCLSGCHCRSLICSVHHEAKQGDLSSRQQDGSQRTDTVRAMDVRPNASPDHDRNPAERSCHPSGGRRGAPAL